MRRHLLILAALSFLTTSAIAQGPKPAKGFDRMFPGREKTDPREMVERQGKAICGEIGLEGERIDSFMNIYRQYCEDLHKIISKRPHPCPDASEEEIEKMILDGFEVSRKMLELRKDYYSSFRMVLSPKEIQKMYFIERHKSFQFGSGGIEKK